MLDVNINENKATQIKLTDMQMISKILVAVDGSSYAEKAFEYASYLAKKCGSGLLIVHVHEEFVGVGHSILKELEQRDLEMLQNTSQEQQKNHHQQQLSL